LYEGDGREGKEGRCEDQIKTERTRTVENKERSGRKGKSQKIEGNFD